MADGYNYAQREAAVQAGSHQWADGPQEAVANPGALSAMEALHKQIEANGELLQRLYERLDLVAPSTDLPTPGSESAKRPPDVAERLISHAGALGMRLEQHRILLHYLTLFAERLR